MKDKLEHIETLLIKIDKSVVSQARRTDIISLRITILEIIIFILITIILLK